MVLDPLTHVAQPDALVERAGGGQAETVIADGKAQVVVFAVERQFNLSGMGVALDVGQRFLRHPEQAGRGAPVASAGSDGRSLR